MFDQEETSAACFAGISSPRFRYCLISTLVGVRPPVACGHICYKTQVPRSGSSVVLRPWAFLAEQITLRKNLCMRRGSLAVAFGMLAVIVVVVRNLANVDRRKQGEDQRLDKGDEDRQYEQCGRKQYLCIRRIKI